MITVPKLIRTLDALALSYCFYGRRREIRTPDPLGVNVNASPDFNGLA
jgi:hypothetical protein